MPDRKFTGQQRQALYDVISARRDIRAYRPEPVPQQVLERILAAAHLAPSVGFMQPWDFVCVDDWALRQQVYDHFKVVNARAAQRFDGARAERYSALKLQGILDAPLNIAVTCDHSRAGEHVLGRDTMPETDVYSTCLAIQNLWLAARAEGVGVGWVSILEPEVVNGLLGIPEGLSLIAYLTLGYPVHSPDEPLLQAVGWRKRLPLGQVVRWNHFEVSHPAFAEVQPEVLVVAPEMPLLEAQSGPLPVQGDRRDTQVAQLAARGSLAARLDELTKPKGSLGHLEALALRLARAQGSLYPRAEHNVVLLFAADHGVSAERVSAYRPQVTAQMVYQFIAGGGAINAFARQYQMPLHVVDVGVDHDFEGATGLVQEKVRRGTRNLRVEPAMTEAEYEQALAVGRARVDALGDVDVLVLGELGIGNTTAATALACALLALDPEQVVGRGTGVADSAMARKRQVVKDALALHRLAATETARALQCLGGYEIVALVGALLQARARRIAVLLDGLIVGVAALSACRLEPDVQQTCLAAHRSPEPAHTAVLAALGLTPLLDLELRLGEGSGAALAIGLVQSACRMCSDVRTFAEAGIEHALEDVD